MVNDEQLTKLTFFGVRSWNPWRSSHPDALIELSGADMQKKDLSGANLSGVDLSRANMRGADLRGANMEGANLSRANLRSADMEGANLSKADMTGADFFGFPKLSRANLSGTNLSGADLSGADLSGANLSGANLNGTDLRRADLRGANLSGADLSKFYVSGAKLSGANLRKANLSGFDLSKFDLSKANLSGADLRRANLSGCDLSEVNLSGADLRKANLWGVNLSGFNLSGANLSRFDLSGFNLSGADLRAANLSGADMEGVNLSGANLSGADLSDVNLSGFDLSGFDLSRANLSGADLSKANLSRAQVLATNFEATIFTGACLADWNTNSEMNLEGAKADYIYLSCEQGEFTERRPFSGNFKPGEFATLFQQALDTLNLIFIDGIDWQAFSSSFQDLRHKYKDANLDIQAIENKGGSFIVRLEVSEKADKSAIEQAARSSYEQRLKRIEARYQSQLQAKDTEIESHKRESANMLEITKLLASKPITVKANAVAENKSANQTNYGGTNFQNDISGGDVNQAETLNVNRSQVTNNLQGATVSNFANQLNDNAQQINHAAQEQNLAAAAQEIQALLDQLSKTYPSETVVEKAQLAEAAALQAQANPSLKPRILSALDAGTLAAIGQLLNHPAAAFFLEAVKDWNQTKPQN